MDLESRSWSVSSFMRTVLFPDATKVPPDKYHKTVVQSYSRSS